VFAELLARSCFSFLRGASQPEELVEAAAELGLAALALTDLDGLYGSVRAHAAHRALLARAPGSPALRYLVGAELTLALPRRGERPGAVPPEEEALTIALLALDLEGYQNLCRLLTLGRAGRPKGECATAPEELLRHARGLSALVVAPRDPGRLTWRWRAGREGGSDLLDLRALGEGLRDQFGERLAVATYRHADGLDRARESWAMRLGRALDVPLVASARPDYHHPARRPLADVLGCIRRGETLETAGAALAPNSERSLQSAAQMRARFADRPEWLRQSLCIAERAHFDFSELSYAFPCELEPGQSADERLAELTWEGAGRRYPGGLEPALRAQLKKELALIKKLDVAPYFLATREVVELARQRSILCQGRGSAANSAVCYVLGITAVDPTRSELLFERFLSEERAEPPDIDIDFEHERREEVIQELYARYGRERAVMVAEVIRYRGKSALRDVGKVLGLPPAEIEALAGSVFFRRVDEASERRLEEAGLDLSDPRLAQVVALAAELEGLPRHLSIHVGGFVLSARPLHEIAPVEPARMPGRTVLPWDKDDIDTLGFFKVDVLALGMLTAIRKCLAHIVASGGLPAALPRGQGTASLAAPAASAPGAAFDPLEVITRIPAEDPETYAMLGRADSVGVFQVESRAQMSMLPRLQPRCFYDLVVEVAIVRPGPIQGGMVHPYLRRRSGQEPVSCPHPDLWKILGRTLGVPLFQEQVMQLAIAGAGYSGGEADQLRRDMAAWKKHGRLLEHRARLLAGFAKKGIAASFAEALFEQIKGFGEYGFPESHASSFALLVYASAWQKCHYPAHFTAALLDSQPMGFYAPTSLVRDAQRHGVEVRDVCVQVSGWSPSLEPPDPARDRITSQAPGARRALRLGLGQVKGLSRAAGERIEAARESGPFRSIEELRRRAALGEREAQLLAEAGALAALEPDRRVAVWQVAAPETPGLFAALDAGETRPELPSLRPVEQLVLDYERKGLCLSDHPLRYYRRQLARRGAVRAADLPYLPAGRELWVAGLVMGRQRPATATGVVFVTLDDETGSTNLILTAGVFERYERIARGAQLLLVRGTLERDDSGASPVIHVLARHLERLSQRPDGSLPSTSRDFH
jgi:error-prone DNA polymerase